jgi:SAM-dependent methyltransferase
MSPEELRRMYELEDTYWWFVGRRNVLRAWLARIARDLPPDPAILDIGCGTGGNALLLREFGNVTGVDCAPAALDLCRERGLSDLLLSAAEDLQVPGCSYDLVTMLEVLEHVKEDGGAVREAYRALKPGGRLLVTVPAYPWLWSEHDEALGHVRRYTRQGLRGLLTEAGFGVARMSHCVAVLLPVTLAFRLAQRVWRCIAGPKADGPQSGLVLLPRPISAVFVWSLRLEAALLSVVDLPIGVTLIADAHRPPDTAAREDARA